MLYNVNVENKNCSGFADDILEKAADYYGQVLNGLKISESISRSNEIDKRDFTVFFTENIDDFKEIWNNDPGHRYPGMAEEDNTIYVLISAIRDIWEKRSGFRSSVAFSLRSLGLSDEEDIYIEYFSICLANEILRIFYRLKDITV